MASTIIEGYFFEEKALAVSFLQKHYYKLGKYLHAPTLKDQARSREDIAHLETYLSSLIVELRKHENKLSGLHTNQDHPIRS